VFHLPVDEATQFTLCWRNSKTEVNGVYSTPEEFKNAKVIGQFGFVKLPDYREELHFQIRLV